MLPISSTPSTQVILISSTSIICFPSPLHK